MRHVGMNFNLRPFSKKKIKKMKGKNKKKKKNVFLQVEILVKCIIVYNVLKQTDKRKKEK